MKPAPFPRYGSTFFRLSWPLRWLFSTLLWMISLLLQAASLALKAFHMVTDCFRLLFLDYTPRPDDIFIVSYPRSGTTWLQMILYQLTTDGNMDFGHIGIVCPWFERTALNKRDLESLPSPRVFKTHLSHRWLPKRGGKFIYVARDGKDVAVSYYYFHLSHLLYRFINFNTFFKFYIHGLLAWGSWFAHVQGWWRHKDEPNVLCLRYEDLKADLEGCIRKIIRFCDLNVPEERMPEILKRCSLGFMKRHQNQFDFAMEVTADRPYTPNSFIRKGEVGGWKELLTDAQLRSFERKAAKRLDDFNRRPASPIKN